jgi:hypothetical protein
MKVIPVEEKKRVLNTEAQRTQRKQRRRIHD